MSSVNSRDRKGRFANAHPDSKYSRGRSRKRPKLFSGNSGSDGNAKKRRRTSASAKKMRERSTSRHGSTQNRIIDINILFTELQKVLCCSACHGPIEINESGLQGFGFKIDLMCNQCGQIAEINSSNKVGPMKNAWEVNRRSVLAMRALGHGHTGLSTFCGIMDLPPAIAHSAFDKIIENLRDICADTAQELMKKAVKEEVQLSPPNTGLTVSGDGTWRKRGFSSLQGVASIIGNRSGKVLDVVIKNSFCKPCSVWEKKRGTDEYEEWYQEHEANCTANHQGCAGKMEVDGMIEMFKRSEEKYLVQYEFYIGDGDSKVFKSVTEAQPYGATKEIKKLECIGHVQKRMGTRLRNLKKATGKKLLTDGKQMGGRGRLTGQVIGKLSSYYGKAIRDNATSVNDMRKAIWATYYHQLSTDQAPQHHYCPKGSSSWCKWQKAKAQKNLKNFKHTSAIPSAIMDKIKPIYQDLSSVNLLQKCLGGFTQNSNESFNNCVWKIVPKTSFSGLKVLEIGTYMAVTCFNQGKTGILDIMNSFECNPGSSAVQWVEASDEFRLASAEKKTEANTKDARIARRQAREQLQDDSYAAGAF